jgi:hypothetical protein
MRRLNSAKQLKAGAFRVVAVDLIGNYNSLARRKRVKLRYKISVTLFLSLSSPLLVIIFTAHLPGAGSAEMRRGSKP